MSGKVMIIGTGNVGASIAYALINQRTAVKEIILTDLDMADAEGEVLDLSDALAVAPSWLRIRAAGYEEARDADICILTAGANQKPGETRIDLIQKNARILQEVVTELKANDFSGILLLVTNPVDALSRLALEYSGLPPERVIGSGTVLDTARLKLKIAETLRVHPKSVHAYQVGEHGDSEVTLWSTANVGGEKLINLLNQKERREISQYVKNEAYEIIKRKGATHYGVGSCVVQIANSILNDERRVLSVSSYDDCTDTYNGFPAIIGREGVARRLEISMTESEGIDFQKSINALKMTLKMASKVKE